ncbi:MAG: class II glutamine amidotransferase domain-containing protein [Planctomycetota bacterium]|jgi:amidophosphoribosyltransferase
MSGIFGVVTKDDCAETLFYGTDYHSHLGTEYGGIAVLGEDFARQIHNLSQSQFKSKFYDDYERIKGNKGIGVVSDYDEQPIYLNSKFGPFCIATAGYIENAEELTEELLRRGVSFSEVSQRAVNTHICGQRQAWIHTSYNRKAAGCMGRNQRELRLPE